MSTLAQAREVRLVELQRLTRDELIALLLQHEASAAASPQPDANMPSEDAAVSASKKQKTQHDSPDSAAAPTQQHPAASSSPTSASSRGKKAPRPFDYWAYPVRHIALRLLYIGTEYHGYAAQPVTAAAVAVASPSPSPSCPASPAAGLPTIEAALFDALLTTRLIASRSSCHYQRCGRTDKGVHAAAQVVSLWLRSRVTEGLGCVSESRRQREKDREERRSRGETISLEEDDDDDEGKQQQGGEAAEGAEEQEEELDYPALLNKHLPASIRVLSFSPAPLSFSARFSCTSRTYHYLCYADSLSLPRMRQAAALMVGQHDWRNLCKQDVAAVSHFIRRIDRVDIKQEEGLDSEQPMLRLEVEGAGFLYHQVRCMVAVLMAVGRGQEEADVARRLLDVDSCRQKPSYPMASEAGLILQETAFAAAALPACFGCSSSLPALPSSAAALSNVQRCYVALRQQYRTLLLRSAVLRHVMRPLLQALQSVSDGVPPLPYQLDERREEGKGRQPMLRPNNLQPSFEEKLSKLSGKKKQRRDDAQMKRAQWRGRQQEGKDEQQHQQHREQLEGNDAETETVMAEEKQTEMKR